MKKDYIGIIICGACDYHDKKNAFAFFEEKIGVFLNEFKHFEIIQGGAPGVDTLAREWAEEKGIDCIEIPADFDKYGEEAVSISNHSMANYLKKKQDKYQGKAIILALPGRAGTEMMVDIGKEKDFDIIRFPDKLSNDFLQINT